LYEVAKDLNCFQACCGQACQFCCCNCNFPLGYTIKGKSSEGSLEKLPDRREEDSYLLRFPPDATEEARVLLLAASFALDYSTYDEPKKEAMK